MSSSQRAPSLRDQLQPRLQRFKKQLTRCLDTPDAGAIHDIRTSFRRLQACYSIYPRAAKSSESERFMVLAQRLFSLYSVIRDSDIMLGKLRTSEPVAETHEADSRLLHTRLVRLREQQLSTATKAARELDKLTPPVMYAENRSLKRRLRRRIGHRTGIIRMHIKRIDKGKVSSQELHSMRKQTKKLYYLLELVTDTRRTPLMAQLKEIHGLAGEIHDCDVTIEYLNDCSNLLENSAQLTARHIRDRDIQFNHLCGLLKQLDWRQLRGLV